MSEGRKPSAVRYAPLESAPRWGRWPECRVRLARDPQAALDVFLLSRAPEDLARRAKELAKLLERDLRDTASKRRRHE